MLGKENACGKALGLVVSGCLDEVKLLEVRHQGRHAVITQTACVKPWRCEGRPQRMHFGQRRHVAGIAEIVGVFAAGQ